MTNTGLGGPYRLSLEKIDEAVTKISPGTYVLEREDSSDSFMVNYVGRSDDDVNGRLKKWVGVKNYKRFKCGYFDSSKAAFEKECKIYHDFGGDKGKMDNDIHPDRAKNKDWSCPVCDIFD